MTTKVDASSNFDAQRMKEDIAKGDENMPSVNVEDDYELAQEFSVSEIDRTAEGAEAAKAATAPDFQVKQDSSIGQSQAGASDADPEAFREMAREVNPRIEQ